MNAILKGILTTLENTARSAVPGGALVDDAVHGIIAAKDGGTREDAIVAAVQAGFDELEVFKPEMIADPIMFNAAVIEAHDALSKIQASLKKTAPTA